MRPCSPRSWCPGDFGVGRGPVERRLAVLLAAGPADGLAVDRDHAGRNAGHRGHPGDEAALELVGVPRGEYLADPAVRRGAVLERAEAPQQVQLFLAEAGNVGKGLGPGEPG